MSPTRLKRNLIVTVFVELVTKVPLYGFEFLLASWLYMNQYAEWAAISLIYRLGPYVHLGALSYFNKQYPLVLGQGDEKAAFLIQEHANTVINFLIVFFFSLSLSLYMFNYLSALAFWVISGVLVMQVFTYAQAKLRNEGHFSAYSIGLVIFSLLQFTIAFFTVKHFGVFAGVMSTLFAYLAAVFYYLFIINIDYLYRLPKRRHFMQVIALGSAPFLLTISSFLTQAGDRVALIMVNNKYQLACYGFFALFFQIGIVAINSLGKVLSPTIFHLSGQKKSSNTLSISMNTCYLIVGLYVVLSLMLFFSGNWMINHYFMKFHGGLLGVYNYATMGLLLSLTLSFYPQLMVASKEFVVIRANLLYFGFNVLVIYVVATLFRGFYVYSFASFLMNMIYTAFVFRIIERVLDQKLLFIRVTLALIFILTVVINMSLWL